MKCCSETLKSLPGSRQKNTYILSGADSLSTLLSLSSCFTTNRICIRAAQLSEPGSSSPLPESVTPWRHHPWTCEQKEQGSRQPQGTLATQQTPLCPSWQAENEFRHRRALYSLDMSKQFQLGADAFRATQDFLNNTDLPGLEEN